MLELKVLGWVLEGNRWVEYRSFLKDTSLRKG